MDVENKVFLTVTAEEVNLLTHGLGQLSRKPVAILGDKEVRFNPAAAIDLQDNIIQGGMTSVPAEKAQAGPGKYRVALSSSEVQLAAGGFDSERQYQIDRHNQDKLKTAAERAATDPIDRQAKIELAERAVEALLPFVVETTR